MPNTVLTGEAVARPFGQGRQRVVERIGLAYGADVTEALEPLQATAEETEEIADAPSPNAYVEELGSDSVVVGCYYWIDDPQNREILAVRSAYVGAAKARLEAAGIDISPTSEHELQGRIAVEDVGERSVT